VAAQVAAKPIAVIDYAGALAWKNKAGKTQQAHTGTAKALAPKAARVYVEQQADLEKLNKGLYGETLRQIHQDFTGEKLNGLLCHVATLQAKRLNIPSGQFLKVSDLKQIKTDKELMLHIATWFLSPFGEKEVKGIVTRKHFELTKSQAVKYSPLLSWASNQVDKAMRQADLPALM
jgi:hypothetical protein